LNGSKVAFRGDVIRRDHGREGWGLWAWVPVVKML
jgi:hypothetical protein